MRPDNRGVWANPDLLHSLHVLWDEGLEKSIIGQRLGVSRDAVIGKARREHRLYSGFCQPRQSPLHQPKPKREPLPKCLQAETQTLPPLASVDAACAVVRPPLIPPMPKQRVEPCNYPIGQPGMLGFHFCAKPSAPGKPYCPEHCRICYINPRSPDGRQIRSEWKQYCERVCDHAGV